jgi:hypothetical protein
MEPAVLLAPTPGLRERLPDMVFGTVVSLSIIVTALSLYLVVESVATGELIQPTPPIIWAAVVVLTAGLTLLYVARRLTRWGVSAFDGRRSRGGWLDALVAAPLALLLTISAAARLAVQIVGFGGLDLPAAPLPFTVVGTTHDRSHNTDYYRLRLRHGEDGRTFSDRVGRAVYEAAQDGDTVILPVETGRFGLQRAMVATPLAVADLHHPR